MRLSNQYRMLFWRQAALTDSQILEIYERYDIPLNKTFIDNLRRHNLPVRYTPGSPEEALAQFKEIQETLSTYTTKTDLLAEWVVKSMSLNSGRYPEDIPRFILALQFYFNIYASTADSAVRLQKIQKFREVVQRFNQERGKSVNPKNILDFTLHDIEKLEDYYTERPVDPRVNRLEGDLPEGSHMFYNDGTYQIIEVTSGEAACHFGRGTRWCTSTPGVAEEMYFGHGSDVNPLYVVFVKGKKYRQLHLNGVESQFVNLQDDPVEIEEPIRTILVKTGLLQKLLTQIINQVELGEAIAQEELFAEESSFWGDWFGRKRIPELEDTIKLSALVSYIYSTHNIGRRALEFEESLSRDGFTAYMYAKTILEGRFEKGEPAILKSGSLHSYVNLLGLLNINQLKPFLDDYPENRRLDEYRFRFFKDQVKVNNTVFRKTGHMMYAPNLDKLIVQYEYWSGEKPIDKHIWLDEFGKSVFAGVQRELDQATSR